MDSLGSLRVEPVVAVLVVDGFCDLMFLALFHWLAQQEGEAEVVAEEGGYPLMSANLRSNDHPQHVAVGTVVQTEDSLLTMMSPPN